MKVRTPYEWGSTNSFYKESWAWAWVWMSQPSQPRGYPGAYSEQEGERVPGCPRDRRIYWPLYYLGSVFDVSFWAYKWSSPHPFPCARPTGFMIQQFWVLLFFAHSDCMPRPTRAALLLWHASRPLHANAQAENLFWDLTPSLELAN